MRGWRFAPAAVAAGALPLLLAFLLASHLPASVGAAWHQLVSGTLLFLLLLPSLREDRLARGVATIGLTFLAHCALGIALSASDPVRAAACMPDGAEYWAKQQTWITTGEDPEYQVMTWLPAHLQLFGAMVGFSYLSLGLSCFWQGFYEVDLMNYYVGQLLTQSASAPTAVGFGWHMWSLTRGVCYSVLVFEVASWSLARLSGRELSTPRRRAARWGVAVGFFLLDCAIKLAMLESVRARLADNLAR